MVVDGEVRCWNDEHGWGVIDSPATPGGCWTHYSHLAVPGLRTLHPCQAVELDYEPADQDGYAFRAVRAWPREQHPHDPPTTQNTGPHTAYRSTMTITWDDDPE